MQKTKPYDDDQLAQDISEDKLSMAQIAAKHGLSLSFLKEIASGRKRPDILRKIAAIWRLTHGDVLRMCVPKVKEMLDIHFQTGRTDKGHTGRRCREYILKRALREEDFRLDDPLDPPAPARRRR